MVNLSSTVFLFAVLQFTSAVPQGGRQASTACVSTSTVFVDFDALLSMAATETDKWSTLAVAESTMVMNGFRSRRKCKNSLYPPIASPSATLLSNSFIVIPGTTEEFKHYSFPESHSSVTLVAMSRLLMPLSKITDPSGMTTSVVASSTDTPEDLTPLLMPLPEIVQPTNEAATPTPSATQTSVPEDLSPLLMPPSNTVQPRSLIQWVKEKLKCDCKEMLRAAKVVRRGVVDWMAKRLEWLTGKNAEELVSAIKTMHGVDVAVR